MNELGDLLASVNATLNASSAILVFFGWRAIRAGQRDRHRALMLSALGVSTLFLIGYLTRIAISGTHRYPGHGALKAFYIALLGSHMILAAITPVLVLVAVWRALKGRFEAHRRIVRYTLPVWLYVSVTGVLVYLMLYQLHQLTVASEPRALLLWAVRAWVLLAGAGLLYLLFRWPGQ